MMQYWFYDVACVKLCVCEFLQVLFFVRCRLIVQGLCVLLASPCCVSTACTYNEPNRDYGLLKKKRNLCQELCV